MFDFCVNLLKGPLRSFISSPTQFTTQVRFRYFADKKFEFKRYGYEDKLAWRGMLPRIKDKDEKIVIPVPEYLPKNPWAEKRAMFGQNDYIDILGDGTINPVEISYNVPGWLKGFRGNEFRMLIRKKKLFGPQMVTEHYRSWANLNKRIRYLERFLNNKTRRTPKRYQ